MPACARVGATGRRYVVHAYHLPADLLGWPEYQPLLDQRQQQGETVLDDLAAPLNTPFEAELIGGSPAEAITNVARARHADEIVVGARGLSPARALLCSVSSELLHHADRPVVVIPAAAIERA